MRRRRGIAAGEAPVVSTDLFTADVLRASPDLQVIARTGVGTDSIGVEAATELGIAVVTTPGANEDTVADHAIAMMLALFAAHPRPGGDRAGIITRRRLGCRDAARLAAPGPAKCGGEPAHRRSQHYLGRGDESARDGIGDRRFRGRIPGGLALAEVGYEGSATIEQDRLTGSGPPLDDLRRSTVVMEKAGRG